MEILIVTFVVFALLSGALGIFSTKSVSIVSALLLADGIAVLSFLLYLLISDELLLYSIGFACFGLPGTIIGITISRKEERNDNPSTLPLAHAPQYNISNNTLNTRDGLNLSKEQQYYIGDKCIGLSARKGYGKFDIAGAYYRNLPITIVGKFNGCAKLELCNEYDKFAIAVYNDTGMHLGYLPKGNKTLHTYILKNGGSVHAYGYIGCQNDGGMYGEVCVETNKEEVIKRNKPFASTERVSRQGDADHPMYY